MRRDRKLKNTLIIERTKCQARSSADRTWVAPLSGSDPPLPLPSFRRCLYRDVSLPGRQSLLSCLQRKGKCRRAVDGVCRAVSDYSRVTRNNDRVSSATLTAKIWPAKRPDTLRSMRTSI